MRTLKLLLVLVVVTYLCEIGVMRAYVETYRKTPITGTVSTIVVLSSGPMTRTQDDRTVVRTRAGIDLYFTLAQMGDEPRLVLSGGKGGHETSKAKDMIDLAIKGGVPPHAILAEGRSNSTLQNAFFSRQLLGSASHGRIAIVTDRFHIPRAWASFRWAGMSDIVMVAADGETDPVDWDNLMLEGVKWPANILRGAIFSALRVTGWEQRDIYWVIQ